jgi:hypothetical protein
VWSGVHCAIVLRVLFKGRSASSTFKCIRVLQYTVRDDAVCL